MSLQAGFLLRLDNALSSAEQNTGMMSVVIQQPFAHLEEQLREIFEGQRDVRVIIDNRNGDRRIKHRKVAMDRRRYDRRSPKEELIEVVMST